MLSTAGNILTSILLYHRNAHSCSTTDMVVSARQLQHRALYAAFVDLTHKLYLHHKTVENIFQVWMPVKSPGNGSETEPIP